jgi:nucleoside-diphosphate-sugar epimerase
MKMRKLVDIIIKEVGHGKVETIDPPEFHKQVGIDDFICDIDPLLKLGWKPKVSLENAIKSIVKHYKELDNNDK